jgi:hypothetical protein
MFLSKELKDRLRAKGQWDPSNPILPDQIDVIVYGQHGPNMALDQDSIRVRGQTLDEFLQSHGLSDKKKAIMDTVVDKTKKAGEAMEEKLDRTAQQSPGERMAEMAAALLFSERPYELTASLVHQQDGESRPIASGVRVTLSKDGIKQLPYDVSEDIKKKINDGRNAIIADQASHELLPLLKGNSISRAGEKVVIKLQQQHRPLDETAGLVAEALKLDPGSVEPQRGSTPQIVFHANGTLPRLTKLARFSGVIGEKEEIPQSQIARSA